MLEQGDQTVREYDNAFMKLRRYLGPIKDDEKAMIQRFTWGLRPDIQGRLISAAFTSLIELIARAVAV